jgi:hypothetical protein
MSASNARVGGRPHLRERSSAGRQLEGSWEHSSGVWRCHEPGRLGSHDGVEERRYSWKYSRDVCSGLELVPGRSAAAELCLVRDTNADGRIDSPPLRQLDSRSGLGVRPQGFAMLELWCGSCEALLFLRASICRLHCVNELH